VLKIVELKEVKKIFMRDFKEKIKEYLGAERWDKVIKNNPPQQKKIINKEHLQYLIEIHKSKYLEEKKKEIIRL